MKLVHAKYGLEISFKEGIPEILVLEDPNIMRILVAELLDQSSGNEGNFVLSDEKLLKVDKAVEMIMNPFALDFQNKKITSALFGKMMMIGNEKLIEKSEINHELINLLEDISSRINYSAITYQLEFNWQDLFKIYGVKIEKTGDFLEDLIEYMKAVSEFCGISVLCFVGLKNYLNHEELLDFYKAARYNKVALLLIESNEKEQLEIEHITIIDRDQCFIQK